METSFLEMGGVQVVDYQNTFIGKNVIIDTNRPSSITVESGVYITHGCTILAHFMDPKKPPTHFDFGTVHIKENAFIGCNTVICKSVTIGENAVIGAGSIVNKDVPSNEIWGGNPVKFIKKRIVEY
ncbi:MAG: acyltransferase [Muribaculum sp.]|nr:acyltransferase [Muribaculum sp.]